MKGFCIVNGCGTGSGSRRYFWNAAALGPSDGLNMAQTPDLRSRRECTGKRSCVDVLARTLCIRVMFARCSETYVYTYNLNLFSRSERNAAVSGVDFAKALTECVLCGQPASGQEQAGQAGMRGRPGQASEARRLAISAGARQATPGCQGLLSKASQG